MSPLFWWRKYFFFFWYIDRILINKVQRRNLFASVFSGGKFILKTKIFSLWNFVQQSNILMAREWHDLNLNSNENQSVQIDEVLASIFAPLVTSLIILPPIILPFSSKIKRNILNAFAMTMTWATMVSSFLRCECVCVCARTCVLLKEKWTITKI